MGKSTVCCLILERFTYFHNFVLAVTVRKRDVLRTTGPGNGDDALQQLWNILLHGASIQLTDGFTEFAVRNREVGSLPSRTACEAPAVRPM